MPTNNFLEIATAGGANVQTQVDYAADADRTSFFPDGGVPDANQHGKMFRQSSVIAHMIAQAICDITGSDMLDDGNAATQLANFKLMLSLSGGSQIVVAGGTVNAITIAPAGPAAYQSGETWWFIQGGANTGAVTFQRDALAIKPIVHTNGDALAANDIPSAGLVGVKYQATLGKFILLTSYSPVPVFGEIIGSGAGNVAIPAGARGCVLEFCGGGGGGGTGDGGAGGPSGTWQDGSGGGDSTVAGVVAKGSSGGRGGRGTGNIYGGDALFGGAGTGASYRGQGGNPGIWTPTSATGNSALNGGSSFFGGGAWQNNSGAQNGGYGAGGAGGQTGNSGSYTGASGAAAETRRVVLSAAQLQALAGNIPYSLGAGGAGGAAGGNFPGGNGGSGYLRYQFFF